MITHNIPLSYGPGIYGPRREKTLEFCKQQRRRPAWASAQSDQHLCYSLIGKYYN